jgi:hypothetical protein
LLVLTGSTETPAAAAAEPHHTLAEASYDIVAHSQHEKEESVLPEDNEVVNEWVRHGTTLIME